MREALTRLVVVSAPSASSSSSNNSKQQEDERGVLVLMNDLLGAGSDDASDDCHEQRYEQHSALAAGQQYEQFVLLLMHDGGGADGAGGGEGGSGEEGSLYALFSSCIELFRRGLGASYSASDRSALMQDQVELIAARVKAKYARIHQPITDQLALEMVEKYLMTALHGVLYEGRTDEDDALTAKIGWLRGSLTPAHLDIGAHWRHDKAWQLAQHELLQLSAHKAPRDKLQAMLKACRMLASALDMQMQAAAKHEACSADALLAVLCYNLVQANPPQLLANIRYVHHYRHPSQLQHEHAYLFVTFSTAVLFLQPSTAVTTTSASSSSGSGSIVAASLL